MKHGIMKKLLVLVLAAVCAAGMTFLLGACDNGNHLDNDHHHVYSAKSEVVKPATCKEEGIERNYCACGAFEDKVLSRTRHDYQYSETESIEPTCMKEGLKVSICSICGDRQATGLEKIPHAYGEWQITEQPTKTKEGTKVRYCTREGCDASETDTVPKVETPTFELSVNILRTTGDAFPNTKGIRLSVKNQSGYEVASSLSVTAKFKLEEGDYVLEVESLPEGYVLAENSFPIKSGQKSLNITVPAAVIEDPSIDNTTYSLGSVMHNTEFDIIGLTESQDTKTTISELLKNYKAILFNIYFKTCPGCLYEVDYLMNAYNMETSSGKIYGNEVAMLMLGRGDQYAETKETMRKFKADPNSYLSKYNLKSRNLPVMMAYCPKLERAFARSRSFEGWPTTVVIDSEGVIIYMKTDVAYAPNHFTSQMDRAIANYDKIKRAKSKDGADNAVPAMEAVLPEWISSRSENEERKG